MNPTEREKIVFNTLKKLADESICLIGGYAVNCYTDFPRFSDDCDIVILSEQAKRVESILLKQGFVKGDSSEDNIPYKGEFIRYIKKDKDNKIIASFDVLIDKLHDRQSGAIYEVAYLLKNSGIRKLKAKTFEERIDINVIDINILTAMKIGCQRKADIRDVIILLNHNEANQDYIRQLVHEKFDKTRLYDFLKKIEKPQFRDNVLGVFEAFPDEYIEKSIKKLKKLLG
ncbi:MAG: hypothetical protein KAS15_02455 [Nanoarchaeota archaeon]|nr:hypothetical protein [Nanoarchaeota archaeon]